jgi:opacity protein-like surface antigen
MGSLNKFIAAAGVSLVLAAGGVQAADMSDPFLEPLLPVEIGSTWYLRGDIGYKYYSNPGMKYTRLRSYPQINGATEDYRNVSIGDALIVGGGVGYKFNPWFRADMTIDYSAPASLSGNLTCLGASCSSNRLDATAQIATWTYLTNAYFDMGTWSGFTPYVGAGIGAANVALQNYVHVNPPGNPRNHTRQSSDETKWNFAWALTAGASYDLTPNWLVDVNYRYTNVGDAQAKDGSGRIIEVDNINAHIFRVGVRYLID